MGRGGLWLLMKLTETGDRSPETLIFNRHCERFAAAEKQSVKPDTRCQMPETGWVWVLNPKPLEKGLKKGVWGFKRKINRKGYKAKIKSRRGNFATFANT